MIARGLILALVLLVPARAGAELLWSRSFDSTALGESMKYSIYLPSGYRAVSYTHLTLPTIYSV